MEIGRKLADDVWASSLKIASPYDNAMHSFYLTPMESGVHYISLDTWYHRMYRRGCVDGLSIFKVELFDMSNDLRLESLQYYDQSGTKSILL